MKKCPHCGSDMIMTDFDTTRTYESKCLSCQHIWMTNPNVQLEENEEITINKIEKLHPMEINEVEARFPYPSEFMYKINEIIDRVNNISEVLEGFLEVEDDEVEGVD